MSSAVRRRILPMASSVEEYRKFHIIVIKSNEGIGAVGHAKERLLPWVMLLSLNKPCAETTWGLLASCLMQYPGANPMLPGLSGLGIDGAIVIFQRSHRLSKQL